MALKGPSEEQGLAWLKEALAKEETVVSDRVLKSYFKMADSRSSRGFKESSRKGA